LGRPSDTAVGSERSLSRSGWPHPPPSLIEAATVSTGVRPHVVVVHARHRRSELIDSLRALRIRTDGLAVDRELIAGINALDPHAVVVDHSIGFDLVRVCRDIRSASTARIIAISDDGPEDHPSRLLAFAAGVDDCLARAGAARRVMARVLAVLTRVDSRNRDDVPARVGDMQLDFACRDLSIGGEWVGCSDREFGLVEALAEQPNLPVTHDELIARLWGPNAPLHYRRRLRILVSRIRKLIGQGPYRPSIVGVFGVGYRLLIPIHDVAANASEGSEDVDGRRQ
jgi:DNA-binding response OmpR family regulator